MTTDHDIASFGALLKIFRKRQRLTQQELAEALGVHRRAVIRWELGDVLPASKAMVLELARRLKLDDQETRHLLEASLTAPAPYWHVPLPRNPYFTGREEILAMLHAQLSAEQAVALTQSSALHGLGGVGKTQIALEYAYRHALEYSAVFWIEAETAESIVSSLLRIAETLQVPGHNDKDQQRVIEAVQRWLSTHSQWLLIWDNVEDLALLDRFLPSTRSGAILLTTRRQALGTLARGLDLLPMEQEEGVLFLLRRAKVLFPEATSEQVCQLARQEPAQYAAAAELVTELGGLPLALDQAGAYLEETRCGLSAYLDLFRSQRAALLLRRGEGARDHPASVSTTFTLAITATAQRHPAVWDLLRVCALLSPDAIPEEIFRQEGESLGPTLEAVCRDPLEWDHLIGIARSYSLLSRQPEEHMLSIHRLVQAVLRESMNECECLVWLRRTIAALNAVFPVVISDTRKQCERFLPHILAVAAAIPADAEDQALAEAVRKAADYLRERVQYQQAEVLYQRAQRIQERATEPDPSALASTLNGLALLRYEQGKYDQAKALCQRTLHLQEQTLRPEHPETARTLNHLAIFCEMQGAYADAEAFFQRALHIRERELGPEHPRVAVLLGNLAELYLHQGNYALVEPLCTRALHIFSYALGPRHSLLVDPLTTLAHLYMEQGNDEQAEALYQQAWQISEQALGLIHPTMVEVLHGQAMLSTRQGRVEQAVALYQRSLSLLEQTLGIDHPLAATSFNGLANLFVQEGRNEEAEAWYQRALAIREQYLGQHHPETTETLHDLALLRQKQGKLTEARALAECALSIRSQALGEHHPKTMATRALYTQLLQKQAAPQEKTTNELSKEKTSNPHQTKHQTNKISPPPPEASSSSSEEDPLQGFLDACCELHPRAWCRSADLWQAYQQWAEGQQERYPLSRGAFITQLKAHSCHADRTMSARIWRGIALVKKGA